MNRAPPPAKINLALVVGPRRDDGKHEVATVLQRVALADRVALAPAESLLVSGFAGDTLVAQALRILAAAAGVEPRWHARIVKRIPVAAGLGGGSSDAATALRLANETLGEPLSASDLAAAARGVGADVPFFLESGPQLGSAEGAQLTRLALPQDYWVVLAAPNDRIKHSTAEVYEKFDRGEGATGFDARRDDLTSALAAVRRPADLASLPPNDLASSPVASELRALGAFRAEVSGAGPAVYGLFTRRTTAEAARRQIASVARTWLTVPAWYG